MFHLRESGGHRIVDPLTGKPYEYETFGSALLGAYEVSRGLRVTVCRDSGSIGQPAFTPVAEVRSLP